MTTGPGAGAVGESLLPRSDAPPLGIGLVYVDVRDAAIWISCRRCRRRASAYRSAGDRGDGRRIRDATAQQWVVGRKEEDLGSLARCLGRQVDRDSVVRREAESEPTVEPGAALEDHEWFAAPVSDIERRTHQGAADALPLVLGRDGEGVSV